MVRSKLIMDGTCEKSQMIGGGGVVYSRFL